MTHDPAALKRFDDLLEKDLDVDEMTAALYSYVISGAVHKSHGASK